MDKDYVRDRRSPIPKSDNVSKVMSSNRGKDTKPEMILRKALRDNGMSGYRVHWDVSGKPDIAYPGRLIAIFVNGCFWHRCPICELPLPKNNVDFWKNKFDQNVKRDAEKIRSLEKDGWKVIVVWECEIKTDLERVIQTIKLKHNRSTK
ncbi:MAG: very short patch repair endonuclease [Candidatus Methanogranum gryphiswaldense]|nr:MAG: very short patch repair endonuclease [Candidatus Methanogranum sp. U3.2.1]